MRILSASAARRQIQSRYLLPRQSTCLVPCRSWLKRPGARSCKRPFSQSSQYTRDDGKDPRSQELTGLITDEFAHVRESYGRATRTRVIRRLESPINSTKPANPANRSTKTSNCAGSWIIGVCRAQIGWLVPATHPLLAWHQRSLEGQRRGGHNRHRPAFGKHRAKSGSPWRRDLSTR